MEELRLMRADDLKEVRKYLKKVLGETLIKVDIQPQYETEYDALLVRTSLTHRTICKAYKKIDWAMLEADFGKATIEFEGQCDVCGEFCSYYPPLNGRPHKYDLMCLKCYDAKRPPSKQKCHVCGKKFLYDKAFHVRGVVGISPSYGKAILDAEILDIHKVPLEEWDCCSQTCAEQWFGEWLGHVLRMKQVARILREQADRSAVQPRRAAAKRSTSFHCYSDNYRRNEQKE